MLLFTQAHLKRFKFPFMAVLQAFHSHSTSVVIAQCFRASIEKRHAIKMSGHFSHLSVYSVAEDSLVNGFNRHEKGVFYTQPSRCPPPIPPNSCILYIPLEQMFTCSYSAFSRLMVGVRHIGYEASQNKITLTLFFY